MSKPLITPRQNPISSKSPVGVSSPISVKLKTMRSSNGAQTSNNIGSNNKPSNGPTIRIGNSNSNAGTPGSNAPSPGSSIITSKEWVLPPRPKPGRKPSVDTPASKRKAQNRAAQRAFRERRATRVQELEAKLLEVEKERDVKEMGLINTINKLKLENQYLAKNLDQMRQEINGLKTTSHIYPHNHVTTFSHQQSPNNMNSNSPTNSIYSVQQISPAPSNAADSPPVTMTFKRNGSSTSNFSSSSSSMNSVVASSKSRSSDDFDCGVCLKDDCLCESVGIKQKQNISETISNFKPMQAVSLKRKAPSLEIDFTNKFKKSLPDLKKLKSNKHDHFPQKNSQPAPIPEKFDEESPVDNCGFCSDDTPCVCREAAKEAARLNQSLNNERNESSESEESESDDENTLPPIQLSSTIRKASLPVMHPGPTVGIRDMTNLNSGQVVTPTMGTPTALGTPGIITPALGTPISNPTAPANSEPGCTGNPGTCGQCQMDPMSTLFCATVANKATESNERGDLSGRSSSISKDSAPSTPISHISLATLTNAVAANAANGGTPGAATSNGMFIPCADAYKTLSRHKKFNSVDFSTLVGKLTTRGMQVEVQSVANVLRELDRRVYN